VELAFQEAGADVTRYIIDLQNKPERYASRINPAGKVGHSLLQVAFIGI
jgi:glutathione S-transferase